MKVESSEAALRALVLSLTRQDMVVLRRVCSFVAGANPSGSRSVTDKFINLVDNRDPTVQTDAAALPVADSNISIVFND